MIVPHFTEKPDFALRPAYVRVVRLPRTGTSNPAQGFYVGVPAQFKAFRDARGCLVLRVPEYPEGLYCDLEGQS